jgi:hypothetical protein
VVGVFGATRPELLYPPQAPLTALTASADCRFCWSRWELAYPSGVCPQPEHACMLSIRVEDVLTAVLQRVEAA